MVPVNLCLLIIDNRNPGNLLCKLIVRGSPGEGALLISQRSRVLIIEKLKCKLTKAARYLKTTHRELFNILCYKYIYKILNLTNLFYVFCVFLY